MSDYVIRVHSSPHAVEATAWDALLASQSNSTPFMRHAFLCALYDSGCASQKTGWQAQFFTLSDAEGLAAACVIYLKDHSYGEYVFDWAWANAYAQHGLAYYPKAVAAVPFTPVPGSRLLARSPTARKALVDTLLAWCSERKLSSLHLLFTDPLDTAACEEAGLMLRHTVQFHWHNAAQRYPDFDHFLQTMAQDKRKKIRQERRKVFDAGVRFHSLRGRDITGADWDFFYRCYERTYLEHGNPPYLSRSFFARMADTMPENWLLFVATRQDRPIAASLIGVQDSDVAGTASNPEAAPHQRVAWGRYWGALERVDCLHFEACYYQPLEWCIAHGFDRFEGGAQGEHKMARALMPVRTTSAHWLAHPDFADAVARFLEREDAGVSDYLQALEAHSPFKQADL